jgi:hypothetical protein
MDLALNTVREFTLESGDGAPALIRLIVFSV